MLLTAWSAAYAFYNYYVSLSTQVSFAWGLLNLQQHGGNPHSVKSMYLSAWMTQYHVHREQSNSVRLDWMAEAFRVALVLPAGPGLLWGLACWVKVERLTLPVQAAWHMPVTQTCGSLFTKITCIEYCIVVQVYSRQVLRPWVEPSKGVCRAQ